MMPLEYITPKEAAYQIGDTEEKVFRLVEGGHIPLFARTNRHEPYQSWRISSKQEGPFEGDLSGFQQVLNELASKVLSNQFRQFEVEAVILEGKHKVGLARGDRNTFPIIERGDMFLRQEDIEKYMNSSDPNQDPLGGHRTNALNALIGAVREFWLPPDPKHPATDEKVSKWVVKNYGDTNTKKGVSKTMGKYIAKIIRSEKGRKGGAPTSNPK